MHPLEKKLRDRFDELYAKRMKERAEQSPMLERVRDIMDAPKRTLMDFWCDKCHKDFRVLAHKCVGTARPVLVAWYVGYCPKGHKAVRRITDKLSDPYYGMSLMVARQRWEMRDAFVQPGDPRFKQLYPEQAKRFGVK